MDDEAVIEVILSSELEGLLARNHLNLVRELQNLDYQVKQTNPVSGGDGQRSAALTLLAAAPVVTALGNAIAAVLRELARGPIKLKQGEKVVVPSGANVSTKTRVKVAHVFEYEVEQKANS